MRTTCASKIDGNRVHNTKQSFGFQYLFGVDNNQVPGATNKVVRPLLSLFCIMEVIGFGRIFCDYFNLPVNLLQVCGMWKNFNPIH